MNGLNDERHGGFSLSSMSWSPAMAIQAEQQVAIPLIPMEQFDQRSTFDAETFAG
jgi:hypothetical protein